MFSSLSLLTNLKGSLNTILVLVGFCLLSYVGFKFYSMDSKIESQAKEIKIKESEIITQEELFNKTVKAYEITIIEVEQVAYNKALNLEINKNLTQVKKNLEIQRNKKLKEIPDVKNICSKCYSSFSF